jgi:hypothetical protein
MVPGPDFGKHCIRALLIVELSFSTFAQPLTASTNYKTEFKRLNNSLKSIKRNW